MAIQFKFKMSFLHAIKMSRVSSCFCTGQCRNSTFPLKSSYRALLQGPFLLDIDSHAKIPSGAVRRPNGASGQSTVPAEGKFIFREGESNHNTTREGEPTNKNIFKKSINRSRTLEDSMLKMLKKSRDGPCL